MNFTLPDNRLVVAVISGVLGAVLTILTQRILGKRGLFTYFVRHNRIGVSADDMVFGTVRVTWNDRPVAKLYSSTVEIRNQSLKDYETVVVRVWTHDTILLTEMSEIVGTTHILEWSDEFSKLLAVPPGSQPTSYQLELYNTRRYYLVPTMNRGQIVRLTLLNAALPNEQPTLWLDILHKGVKLKFRNPSNESILGVPQPAAALVGSTLGLLFLAIVIALVDTVWVAGLACLLYGILVLIPGALSIRLLRWLRDLSGD